MSVSSLILAGVVPAILLTLCNLGAAYYVARQARLPDPVHSRAGTSSPSRSRRRCRASSIVVIIIAGILSGAFTATESAAVAVLWALLLTVFAYRTLTLDQFIRSAAKAVKTTGVVLLLIGISSMFGYLIGLYERGRDDRQRAVARCRTSRWVIFLAVNVILFLLGTFLDMAATILICTPIFLPICQQFGMDHGPVRHRDADQLRAGPEHPAGRARRSSSAARSAACRWAR